MDKQASPLAIVIAILVLIVVFVVVWKLTFGKKAPTQDNSMMMNGMGPGPGGMPGGTMPGGGMPPAGGGGGAPK